MTVSVDGPFYDELAAGQVLPAQPAVTIDAGMAAVYQSIMGERLPLALDDRLSAAVTGGHSRLASPGLALSLTIGQSTVATRRVIANLFYRDVRLHRQLHLGESLRTVVTVKALADAAARPDRGLRGKVLLGMTTTADDEVVASYERCALLPVRGDRLPGHADALPSVEETLTLDGYLPAVPRWRQDRLPPSAPWSIGETRTDPMRDRIESAGALVRLTHNQAMAHRDPGASPYERVLVYGGHVVGLAQASLSRLCDGLATVIGWHSCDHAAPAFEGDVVESSHELLAEQRLDGGGALRAYRVIVRRAADDPVVLLTWVPVVLVGPAS
jgi:2-methylfumaryl-CoA hydratase